MSIAKADIIAGGKTVIVTLTNDTFVPATFPNIRYVGGQVGGRAGSTSTSAITFALTGGLASVPAAGDLVIITVVVGSVGRNPACAVSGYTALGLLNSAANTNDTSLDVSRKFMGGTPDTTFTLPSTGNVADAQSYTVHVLRGVDPTTPLDVSVVSAVGGATGRPNPGAITPATTGAWILVCGGGCAAAGAQYVAAADFAGNFITRTDADTTDSMVGSGYYTGWVSGAYDPAAFTSGTTGANDSWCAYTIAIRPVVTTPFPDGRAAMRDGGVSAQSEAAGWNVKVKPNIPLGNIVRTSSTVATITLQAQADYLITAPDVVTWTVPGSMTTSGAPVVATPTIAILPGITSYTPLVSGGATLSGAAAVVRGKILLAPTGTLTTAGAAPGIRGKKQSVSGGATTSGAVSPVRGKKTLPTGGLTASGAAATVRSKFTVATGTLTASGAAAPVRGKKQVGSGGATFGGASTFVRSKTVVGTGGLTASGAATIAFNNVGTLQVSIDTNPIGYSTDLGSRRALQRAEKAGAHFLRGSWPWKEIEIGSGSSVLGGLTGFWSLDNDSGTRVDAVGTSHLTDNNGVGWNTVDLPGDFGEVADFEASTFQYLSVADNPAISAGDTNFTWQFWVRAESLPTNPVYAVIASKGWGSDTSKREWAVYPDAANSNRIVFAVGSAAGGVQVADSGVTMVVDTWYCIHVWHDATNNLIGIAVNDGTAVTASRSTGVQDGAEPLAIGASIEQAFYWDGCIANVGRWDHVLTTDERTTLYAGGAGLVFSNMGGAFFLDDIIRLVEEANGKPLWLNLKVIDANVVAMPDDLVGLNFDHSSILSRFHALLDAVYAVAPNVYGISVGSDIAGYLGGVSGSETTEFAGFILDAKSYIHSLWGADTIVTASLSARSIADVANYADVLAAVDAPAWTYYFVDDTTLMLRDDDPVTMDETLGDDLFALYQASGSVPMVIEEFGCPSSADLGSSETLQAACITNAFAVFDVFVANSFLIAVSLIRMHEYPGWLLDALGYTTDPTRDFQGSLGLRNNDDTPKLAWAALTGYLQGNEIFFFDASGGLTISGSSVVAHGRTVVASGGAVLSGAVAPVRHKVQAPSGGAVLSGASTIVRTKLTTATGGAVSSGAAVVTRAKRLLAAGTLVAAGLASIVVGRAILPTGGAVLSGAATTVRSARVTPSGGAVFGGSATTTGGATFSMTGSGGATLSGASTITRGKHVAPSGSLVTSGAVTLTRGRVLIATGTVTTSGAAVTNRGRSLQPTGGLLTSGAALVQRTRVVIPTGAAVASGAAVVIRGAKVVPSGTITTGGTATFGGARAFSIVGSGGASTSGAALVKRGRAVNPVGGAVSSGAAVIIRRAFYAGSGAATTSGAAGIARGKLQTVSGGAVSTGAAIVVRGRAITAAGGVVASGAASVYRGAIVLSSGGLVVSGLATQTKSFIVLGSGGIELSGIGEQGAFGDVAYAPIVIAVFETETDVFTVSFTQQAPIVVATITGPISVVSFSQESPIVVGTFNAQAPIVSGIYA